MEYKLLKNTVRISNLTFEDIKNLLKCDCKMKIVACDNEGVVVDFIYLLDRKNSQEIIISSAKKAIKKEVVSYQEAFSIITQLILNPEVSEFYVVVDQDLYKSKKVIFDILPLLKPEIRAGLISMNYTEDTFIIKTKDDTGFINSVYFWPKTKDFYIFSPTEPKFYIVDDEHAPIFHKPEDFLKLFG